MSVRPTKTDQPGHPPSLIRVFAVRMKKAWVLSYPLSAKRRLWSDWVDAQAVLSLRRAHSLLVLWCCGLYLFPQKYPMAVVGTAARGLIIYQLENQPQEFRKFESPLKYQVSLSLFKLMKWPVGLAKIQISLSICPIWECLRWLSTWRKFWFL